MVRTRPYTPAVPYELPRDRRADRRGAIWRWVTFVMVAVLVALFAYLAYVGFVGSGQVVEPPAPSRDCRTPSIAHGWGYEAVNYEASSDAELAELPDPTDCDPRIGTERADLATADGVSLAAWYIPAGNGAGPEAPTIVLAHGHGANKSGMLSRAEVLHPGYNLVLFDFRNHGQSEDAATTVGLLERNDLRAVIDWLEANKAPRAIGLLGVSMGGAAAINESRGDPRVAALVIESTHATLANALTARLDRQGYPLSLPAAWSILLGGLIRTGQDMSAGDPLQAIEGYGERPLLIIAGGSDDSMGATDAQDLLAAALDGGAQAELKVCPTAGHGETPRACPGEYRDWVLGFFADAIGT